MTLSGALLLSNVIFFALSAAAVAASVAVFFIARANDRAKDRELAAYQAEAAAQVANARKDADVAKADAARANERAAALESDAAHARVEQETLRKANLELEQRISYRHLDRFIFMSHLFRSPKATVNIEFPRSDKECYQFAMQIELALSSAKWAATLHPVDVAAPINPALEPLILDQDNTAVSGPGATVAIIANTMETGSAADFLASAFNAVLPEGVNQVAISDMPPDTIRIEVRPRL